MAPVARPTLLLCILVVAGCGTTHQLPPYETPLARAAVQSVRTTAYTHTEADHVEYGNHSALGGTLRAAVAINDPPAPLSSVTVAPPPVNPLGERLRNEDDGGYRGPNARPSADVPAPQDNALDAPPGNDRRSIPTSGVGSAAADWSRWPAGTVFRIAATGQVYQVDDYGWALAGRNTIDLYQPTRSAMNAWGTRHVEIEILRWGDPAESLRMLRHHQGYRHIHRMVLELEGNPRAAAALE